MTRLTKAMRDQIIERAIAKSGLQAAVDAEIEKRYDWAERVRIFTLGGAEKAAEYAEINANAEKIYNSLPVNLRAHSSIVDRNDSIRANLAGASVRIVLRKHAESVYRTDGLTADNPLVQEFYDLEAEKKSATEAVDNLRRQLSATIGSFSTVATLLKAWPEAAELVCGMAQEAKPKLPALPVAELNKALGLTSGV